VPNDSEARPHDLHALSTPPAFILSQDQTLNKVCLAFNPLWDWKPE